MRVRNTLDVVGFSLSVLCAVHCLVLPFLFTLAIAGSWSFLQSTLVENSVLMISLVLAVSSLLPAYFKHHKKLVAVYVFAGGFILIGLSRLDVNEVWEISTTSIGAALVASAHYINYRLQHVHKHYASNKI